MWSGQESYAVYVSERAAVKTTESLRELTVDTDSHAGIVRAVGSPLLSLPHNLRCLEAESITSAVICL